MRTARLDDQYAGSEMNRSCDRRLSKEADKETGTGNVNRKGSPVPSFQFPWFSHNITASRSSGNLIAEGQIRDKSNLTTIDPGASMTIAKPDITTGLAER
jgi:hypothetical protein